MPPQRLEDLGEEFLGAFFLGVVKNLRGSSHFDDFALSHEDHSVGNFSCKAHFGYKPLPAQRRGKCDCYPSETRGVSSLYL